MKNPRSLRVVLLTFWAIGAFLPLLSPVLAQEDGEAENPFDTVFETVDVEIINVDVWVSDKEGEPVHGLNAQDFVVYRDGNPVPIEGFYAVAEGRPLPIAEPEGSESSPEKEPTSTPDLPPERDLETTVPEQHRQWLIVYVDNYNIMPNERNRIMPSLRRFLSQSLQSNDRAMVVTYGRSLNVRQPFTDDKSLLTKVLMEVEEETGYSAILHRERQDTLKLIDDSKDPSRALLTARRYAEELMLNVTRSVENLHRLIDTLGGLPGRKTLVYVSSGVPMLAGEEMFQVIGERWNYHEAYGEIGRHDTTRKFEAVDRSANSHRVVLYTLDAGGLRGSQFGSAEYGTTITPRLRSMLDSIVPQNLQAPLRLMALETGGRAILNQNEVFPALQKVNDDFRSFYSLGLSSSGVDSGRYHEIEVKLKERHRGWTVRHRSGYRSKSIDTRIEERLRSALLYSHESNPLNVKVGWGLPEPYDKNTYLLTLQLKIPLQDLVILPLAGKQELRLKVFVGAAGEDGAISTIDNAPLGLRLDNEHLEAARGESFLHTHKLLLKPGRNKVGIALLDQFGQRYSLITGFVDAGLVGD